MTGSRQAHDKGRRLRMQRRPHARRTRGNASDVARHLAGLEAGRAHVEALGGAVDESTHTLDIGVPPAVGPHVGVRDALAEDGALAANVAHSSHGLTPDLQCFNAQVGAWRQVLPPKRGALGNPRTIADRLAPSQAAGAWVRAHAGLTGGVWSVVNVFDLTVWRTFALAGAVVGGLTSVSVVRAPNRLSVAQNRPLWTVPAPVGGMCAGGYSETIINPEARPHRQPGSLNASTYADHAVEQKVFAA